VSHAWLLLLLSLWLLPALLLPAQWDGRIGDTPMIGAGTWADQKVALSGEFVALNSPHELLANAQQAAAADIAHCAAAMT
jgi:isoaspartyl peptidase/L-asparaginase-like protein (Ntn-hydrolase superfamily)